MNRDKTLISIVTPVYRASECLDELYRRLVAVLERLGVDFEVVMVNDASPDGSWHVIEQLARRDLRVKAINLSRNFGQHYAITAGIDHAQGDWVVVMDCDLQHLPEDIERLYRKALEGHDAVFVRRVVRKDGALKKLFSRAFGLVYDYLTELKIHEPIGNFSIVSRPVVENLRAMRERSRSFPLMVHWLGFDIAYIDGEHAERFAGKSSYNFGRSMRLAIDSIASQSNRPLQVSVNFGFLMAFLSLSYGVYLIIRYLLYGIPVPGWTSVIVAQFFIGGLLFANLGILGMYLGRVFSESKNRPLYVVKQRLNVSQDVLPASR